MADVAHSMSAEARGTSADELLRRLGRAETLARVSRVIHSTLEPREALRAILGEVVALMRANSGSICLLNPTTGLLEIEAEVGLPAEARGVRLRLGQGITGWVVRTGGVARVGNVSGDRRYVAVRAGVASEMAVPLRVGGEVRGVLNVDSDRRDAFDEGDQGLMEELAELAAQAIRNSWLYESARQRARLLESLVRVSQRINSTVSLDDALQAITQEARTLIGAKVCSLMMVDETGEWLDLRACHGAGARYREKPRLAISESLLGNVVRRHKPLQVEDVQASGRYQHVAVAREEGLVSLLAVPLLFEGRALGALTVYTAQPHLFPDEEVRTLSAYAELSALALEKARLYDRLMASEEELRQSERLGALGLLAAEVAHEIRNPLTVMKMLHHSLGLEFEEGDPRGTDFRIMGEKMDHLNRIVDRVLDFARPSEPVRTQVDVNGLLRDLGFLLRAKLKHAGVELNSRLDEALPRITGDPTQLEQAFLNLSLNAVEAMPQGGRLVVSSRIVRSGDRRQPVAVVVRFRDTGEGMSPDQRARLFTSLLGSTKPQGNGLGLAIVRRIVEGHGGVIHTWSEPGRGSAFTVALPVRG
jgi:signal transduction histidine kinase